MIKEFPRILFIRIGELPTLSKLMTDLLSLPFVINIIKVMQDLLMKV